MLRDPEQRQSELCLRCGGSYPRPVSGNRDQRAREGHRGPGPLISYLQRHFRTKHRGGKPREPIMVDYRNIECRDAVLTYDGKRSAE
jgi:hypothetical protein